MQTIFKVKLEFCPDKIDEILSEAFICGNKGYVCAVDANVLTMAHKDDQYREIINNAYINVCDGTSIVSMAHLLYRGDYYAYTGPQLFQKYVEDCHYRQVLLGNTTALYNKVLEKSQAFSYPNKLEHYPLPFQSVDSFNYSKIAEDLNKMNPQIIWVSLGAPKQEVFMSKLLPYLKMGMMFGIGAAPMFYVNNQINGESHSNRLCFTWVHRLISEPRKQIKRVSGIVANIIPIFFDELIEKRNKSSH